MTHLWSAANGICRLDYRGRPNACSKQTSVLLVMHSATPSNPASETPQHICAFRSVP